MKKILIFCFVTISLSCEKRLTTNDEIYDLLQFVIADQGLDSTYGLQLDPEENCDLNKSDKEFLTDLIVDEPVIDTTIHSGKYELIITTTFELKLTKCLTQDDVDFMLSQKNENKSLEWDNARLGFRLENRNDWYVFSVPLFSRDKQKAVMMVRQLCKGLCGTGWTLLLTKENNKWTSEKGLSWIH